MAFIPDYNLNDGDLVRITRPDGSVIFIKITNVTHVDGVTDTLTLDIVNYHSSTFMIDWHNCYSFGNGVESNRIRDTFNKPFITSGVTVSTVFEDYKEEYLKNGLIYSGLYNSASNTNNLNQFVQAEKITKNINPVYGSIQKLHARDTDLITLCEDKIIKILANKDAVYNADGNPQLTANENVLGQAIPFIGEYGISKNPESFASESYRTYFTDKARGAVLRLSKDGLTAISDHGMKSWFRDNLKLGSNLIGSYDDKKDEYNITLKGDTIDTKIPFPTTVSFKENVTGWVSFKSFVPENGISCNGNYYTFNQGRLWLHHQKLFDLMGKEINRNIFYNTYTPSSVTVLLNDAPGVVKTFNTLNYEGSQSRIHELITYDTYIPGTTVSTGTYNNPDYYNLADKDGWYVECIITDQEKGSLEEFIEKEGKWFNYIRGKTGVDIDIDGTVNPESFNTSYGSFQGLGILINTPIINSGWGCTDPTAFNYDSGAVIDDGSCIAVAYGCTDPTADNYDVTANTSDGSCIWAGCTIVGSFNFCSVCNQNDGSCIAIVNGCMDSTAFNYDPSANVDDGSCMPIIYGCTDTNASNPCTNSCNTDDGSCIAFVYGCMDVTACNYDPNVNIDDGSCTDCGISGADNYSGYSCGAGGNAGCKFCENIIDGSNGWQTFGGFQSSYLTINNIVWNGMELQWDEGTIVSSFWPAHHGVNFTNVADIVNFKIIAYWEDGSGTGQTTTTTVNQGNLSSGTMNTGGTLTYNFTTLQGNTEYKFFVYPECVGGTDGSLGAISSAQSGTAWTHRATTPLNLMLGCTCDAACNYDPLANTENNTCDYSCYGCTDPGYLEYDSTATMDWPTVPTSSATGITLGSIGVVWCTPTWDSNYNYVPGAIACGGAGCGSTTNNCGVGGCCVNPIVYGCTDPNMFNYDPLANTDDGTCGVIVPGCMDDSLAWNPLYMGWNNGFAATNYNPLANTPGDPLYYACTYLPPYLMNLTASEKPATSSEPASPSGLLNITMNFSTSSTQITHATIWGFIGNNSHSGNWYQFYNFQWNGINSNNFAQWGGVNGWPDPNNSAQGGNVDTHNLDITETSIGTAFPTGYAGTTIRNALIAEYGVPEGSVTAYANSGTGIPNHGVTTVGTGYQTTQVVSDINSFQAVFIKYGCLDQNASTYDSTANVHWSADCSYGGGGCTDDTALNYDPTALVDDGSCVYAQEFNPSTISWQQNWFTTMVGGSTYVNGWHVGFTAPNITQGINTFNSVNYANTFTNGSKDFYVLWVKCTNAAGEVWTDYEGTTVDGWMRVVSITHPAHYGAPYDPYRRRSTNYSIDPVPYGSYSPTWDFSGGDVINFPLPGQEELGWGASDTGMTVEVALYPIIDRSKLDPLHPEYDTTPGTNGSRLTVPYGGDATSGPGATPGSNTYLSGPTGFPAYTATYTIT